MTTLPPEAYRGHIAAETGRVSALLAGLDASAWATPVPTCGAWTLRDLVSHLGVVHRVDAEIALGAPSPVPADAALDGVAEVLDELAPRLAAVGALEIPRRGLVLLATDGPVGGTDNGDGSGAGSATGARLAVGDPDAGRAPDASGPAADLLLALWKRGGTDGLDIPDPAGAHALGLAWTP